MTLRGRLAMRRLKIKANSQRPPATKTKTRRGMRGMRRAKATITVTMARWIVANIVRAIICRCRITFVSGTVPIGVWSAKVCNNGMD